jgi:DNA-binding GntR family transcriptional regulator
VIDEFLPDESNTSNEYFAHPLNGQFSMAPIQSKIRRAEPTDYDALQFVPIDRASLQEQAYEQLRRAILNGSMKPGTALTIRSVAAAIGTSPMPARGALQRLEIEGALVARGGKRVLEICKMTRAEYLELRDIGIQLEGMAAERAAQEITADELDRLERICTAMQAAADANDLDGYLTANWDFHLTIYQASKLTTLIGFIEKRWLRIGPYVRMMMPDHDSLITSMPNHWDALNALKRRDGKGAFKAIASDLEDCAVTLLAYLD